MISAILGQRKIRRLILKYALITRKDHKIDGNYQFEQYDLASDW